MIILKVYQAVYLGPPTSVVDLGQWLIWVAPRTMWRIEAEM